MRLFHLVMMLAFWNCVAIGTALADPEVHAIGVYEGSEKDPDGTIHGPIVRVRVDRPGADVTLYLGSYEPVRWIVDASEGTHIQKFVLHGYQPQDSEVLLNGNVYRDADIANFSYSYATSGSNFRALVDAVSDATGQSLSSFAGAYGAPAEGFVVDHVVTDVPEYSPNYLADQIAPTATVPETLRKYLEANDLARMGPPEVRLGRKGFTVSVKGRPDELVPITLDVPVVSWPMGAARDPETGVLYGVTLGGEGYVYQYDPGTEKWSVLASMKQDDASGMFFDPDRRKLVVVISGLVSRAGDGFRVFDLDGKSRDVRLQTRSFPGLLDLVDIGNGPGAKLTPLAVSDGKVLLVATGSSPRQPNFADEKLQFRTYLVDIDTGAATLVSADDLSLNPD